MSQVVAAEGAAVEDRIAVASNWKLVWWRFRRHKLALFSAFVLILMFIWIRATIPRVRYDQLMSLGWKILLPIATLNALVTAVVVTLT